MMYEPPVLNIYTQNFTESNIELHYKWVHKHLIGYHLATKAFFNFSPDETRLK